MKLQFKHQKFQADAAKAVVDVFAGQPYLTPSYMMDRGYQCYFEIQNFIVINFLLCNREEGRSTKNFWSDI